MKIVVALLLSALLGCVHTYEVQQNSRGGQAPQISSSSSIFVGFARDGQFEVHVYAGSGEMTTRAIVSAISSRVRIVRSASDVLTLEGNLAAARAENFEFLIHPTILRWEERATEWSGLPDRISVALDLVNVLTGKIVYSTIILGESRWATFGGDHPQDLLPEPLRSYVDSILAN